MKTMKMKQNQRCLVEVRISLQTHELERQGSNGSRCFSCYISFERLDAVSTCLLVPKNIHFELGPFSEDNFIFQKEINDC